MRYVLALAGLAVLLTGCGSGGGGSQPVNPNSAETSPPGDIPDNQAFVAYTPPGGGYSVKVPEGWARTGAGGAVTFTDKLNAIRMESVSAASAPPVASVQQIAVTKLTKTVKGFRAGGVAAVQRHAGRAIRVRYVADAPANAVTNRTGQNDDERYVSSPHGHDVILPVSGPKGADNVDPWRIVTDSLQWSR